MYSSRSYSALDTSTVDERASIIALEPVPSTRRLWLVQVLVGTGVFLVMMQTGVLFGWASPYLVAFIKRDSPLHITKEEGSWIASLANLGSLLGAVFGAVAVHKFGSRIATLLAFVPVAVSWIIVFSAQSPNWLYASRTIGGVCMGITFAAFPLYVGEVAPPRTRGAMVGIGFVGSPFGSLIASIYGSFLPYKASSICFFIPCVLGILIFAFLPDSPQYLLKKDRIGAAEESLKWYRGGGDVTQEFDDVKAYVELSSAVSFQDQLREFKLPYIRRAMILVIILYLFMQVTGVNTLGPYSETIFRYAKIDVVDPPEAVIYGYVVGTLASFFSVMTIDKLGRKILLILSSVGVALTMTTMGVYLTLQDRGYDLQNFQIFFLTPSIVFRAASMLGLYIIPSTVLSEIFSQTSKCIAGCFASIASGIWAFLAAKAYQPLADDFSIASVLFLHAILATLVVPFVLFVMPETKGKSLNQIQRELMKRESVRE